MNTDVSMFFGLILLFVIVVTWWQYALIGVAVWLLLRYVM
jgi:hypothetical protein